MYECLSSSIYSMTADVYRRTSEYDSFGQVTYSWTLFKTVNCYAHSVEATGRSFGSQETWDSTYDYEDLVKLKTGDRILVGDLIKNIRSSSDEIIWQNENGVATDFLVSGVAPKTSVFGEIVEFDVMLKRAEVQS